MTLALTLSLLVGGTAVSIASEEVGMQAANDKIIKPFKTGLETRCHYDELKDVYICRL